MANCRADDDELTKDVRVYALADRFLMKELKDYTIERLEARLEDLWISEGFIDCIREVYSSTNEAHRKLRDLVARKAHSGLAKLWVKKPFQDLIREGGDFAVDLTALSVDNRHR